MRQVINADTCVAIEIEKRLVFFPESKHELSEQRVLEHVGEIAGVELMTVGEHAAP